MKEDLRVLSVGKIEEMMKEIGKWLKTNAQDHTISDATFARKNGAYKTLSEIKEMLLSNPSAENIWKASRYDDEIEHPTTGQLSWGYKYNTLEDYLETVKLK